jgi:hypothetical protein
MLYGGLGVRAGHKKTARVQSQEAGSNTTIQNTNTTKRDILL